MVWKGGLVFDRIYYYWISDIFVIRFKKLGDWGEYSEENIWSMELVCNFYNIYYWDSLIFKIIYRMGIWWILWRLYNFFFYLNSKDRI